jgi:hypothetical protein
MKISLIFISLQKFPIHIIRSLNIDVSVYPNLTIQASSRLKRSANNLWNNRDVCRNFCKLVHKQNVLTTFCFVLWIIHYCTSYRRNRVFFFTFPTIFHYISLACCFNPMRDTPPNHYWASTVRDSWLDVPWCTGRRLHEAETGSTDQWILRNVLIFQPRRAKHHYIACSATENTLYHSRDVPGVP